ncbi:hypothetical protein [Microbacterium sp. TNHR37B]|uniref:hypothetical protein n=1 Tax=Microbacterium sp. TNHR37B TaxID=1775956 RepID=UPI0007B280B7|nr:hypothetical protein [Microbacterium sp. TNHR37B]KZE90955.1 hypothetical protein AVP41_00483 [Microbacterium sp. TNHR37B]
MNRRGAVVVATLTLVVLPLAACAAPASPAGSSPDVGWSDARPGLPEGEVRAQGTVLDDGSTVSLCLGAVRESAPPQCEGIPLMGWDWDGVDGSTTTGGTTWGAYAVRGTYDGAGLTVTQPPIMLALYDPLPPVDPTGGVRGEATAAEAEAISREVSGRVGESFLGAQERDGWVWLDVVWDDGTWQDAADGEFGARKVVVRSALQEIATP